MKNNAFFLVISLILVVIYFASELNASGGGRYGSSKLSLKAARIADAYNEYISHEQYGNERAAVVTTTKQKTTPNPTTTRQKPTAITKPTATSKTSPKTTKPPTTTTTTSTTTKTSTSTTTTTSAKSSCPFNSNMACSSTNKYQSFDGTCNNLAQPLYGSVDTPYTRFLAPQYGDGSNSPRALSVDGVTSLPNPRKISTTLFNDSFKSEKIWTHLYTIFGQFITHDMTSLAPASDSLGNTVSCPCSTTNTNCYNIQMPTGDTVMNQSCIQFTRSSPSFQNVNCQNQTYREQLNLISSYLDCSQIYGSTVNISNSLRAFVNGTLKTSAGMSASRPYLPKSTTDQCSANTDSTFRCFTAGENRTSENLGLAGVQTLFLRQHNRMATKLAAINPSWNDQTLFYETRRIVQAIYQHIVFSEWIPATLGANLTQDLRPRSAATYFKGYNASVCENWVQLN